MRNRRFYIAVLCVLCVALLLSACGLRRNTEPSPTPQVAVDVQQPQDTPTPAVTTDPPAVEPTAEPTPTPTPEPTPEPTPAPTPEPTPTPTPAPGAPTVTKSPTDETVTEGGSCYFVAKYVNATWAVWHFVSPDGQTDLDYKEAQEEFRSMEIIDGMYSTMQLKNIPLAASGWSVYCRYSNNAGSVDTARALLTVNAKSA